MVKSKIAISLDNSTLKTVDSKVDGSVIRSRSQAIEYFLKKGLQEQSVSVAVLLLKGEHPPFPLKEINGASMIKKHMESEKLATMGLMTREKASSYGTAILDGDLVVDFQEKPKHYSTNIVNAGIYIFKPEIFEMFDDSISLEKDLFPKLARIKQLVGFFTYGEYLHASKA